VPRLYWPATTFVVRPSGTGPSTGRGDAVSAGDFSTVGDISLGAGNSRGASGDMVRRGSDNDALGAHDLSASAIGSEGLASRVLES
jgi:hypothetical protein